MLRFFEKYREVPIEYHWRGSPLRGRRTLAETGRGPIEGTLVSDLNKQRSTLSYLLCLPR